MVTCPLDVVWPSATGGWHVHRCWAVGEHDVHTDDNGAPLCTTAEAAWMAEQHRLCTQERRRTWPGAIA